MLGAVFEARSGTRAGALQGLDPATLHGLSDAVQTVFLGAAPLAALALLVVTALPEVPLRRA